MRKAPPLDGAFLMSETDAAFDGGGTSLVSVSAEISARTAF